MLLQFNFSNNKSFAGKNSFDMTATAISELKDTVVSSGGHSVLPVSAVYGANAGGKSNFVGSLRYMWRYMCVSHVFGMPNKQEQAEREHPQPFAFSKQAENEPSEFELFFTLPEQYEKRQRTYQYGFSILGDTICEEWLYYKTKSKKEFQPIFYRQGMDELEISDYANVQKYKKNIELSLKNERLALSVGASVNVPLFARILEWLISWNIINFGNPHEASFHSRSIPGYFDILNPEVQTRIHHYLASFDPSIRGFVARRNKEEKEKFKLFVEHASADEEGATIRTELVWESSGTQRMFTIFPFIEEVMQNGSVLVVDELNSQLHPLLMRNLILTFTNPAINTNHAQLIFTSHDVWQLASQSLRRDEIWFIEKDDKNVSTLYSLADIFDEGGDKIRKDENWLSNYLVGKYGGIPELSGFDVFKEVPHAKE